MGWATRDANNVGQDCLFDARNRDIQCTDTHGDVTKRVYDAHNNVVTMIDALNHNTTCVFDARDRKISCTDRIAGTTNYVYDSVNNLLTLTDAQGGATHYVFDVRNLLQTETFPDGKSRYYGYDAGHRIVSRLDQAGVVTNYVYDRANRMTSRTYPDSLNDTFSYDNASRLTLASSARYSNSVARVYDAASHLTLETLSVGATSYNIGYGYDADNRQTAVIYPSGDTVNRAFTDRNQLQSASFNTIPVANLSYDDGRRLSTKSFGNGTVENRTYRNDNLISSIATPTVDAFTYTWDSNKRKLTQTEAGIPTNDQTFTYDSEDRLTNFARTNGDAQSWNLSLVGDWNSFNKNGILENRTHNAVHELLTVNTTPLTYDVKGNLTSNSNGQFYAWDVENRLILATDGFNTLGTYTYDALGRRTTKTVGANTTTFVSDGLQEVSEYVNGALSQSYVYGSYIDEPLVMVKSNGDKFYYHTNDLYSVAALSDQNGTVVERYKYDPYGKVTVLAADGVTVLSGSTVNNAIGFTGRRLDAETGLMYYRARMYSSDLGRFVSRDPIDYDGSRWNLYEYVNGNPTYWMDPLGLECIGIDLLISFMEDDTTNAAGNAFGNGPNNIKVRRDDAGKWDWTTAISKIANLVAWHEGCLGGDCIHSILITGHGYGKIGGKSGGFELYVADGDFNNPKTPAGRLLNLFRKNMCKENTGIVLASCGTAADPIGKKFLSRMAIIVGTKVKGWDDWFALVPYGKEYTALPNSGIVIQTGDTGRTYDDRDKKLQKMDKKGKCCE